MRNLWNIKTDNDLWRLVKNTGSSSTISKKEVTAFVQNLKKQTSAYAASATKGPFLTVTSTKDNVPSTVASRVPMWEMGYAVLAEWTLEDDEGPDSGSGNE